VVVNNYKYNTGGTTQRGWLLGDSYGSENRFDFWVFSSTGSYGVATLTNFFTTYAGQWVHVAGVFVPGQSVALYVNGVKVAEDTSSVPTDIGLTGIPLKIGARSDNTTQGWWDGRIDDVRISARSLSPTEVQNMTGEVICSGRTTPGNTNWQVYGTDSIYLDVDTSICGFTTTPLYFTSLGGSTGHWTTRGATSIYLPTPRGFHVFVNAAGITPALANQYQWHINWKAAPNNLALSQVCTGRTTPGSTNWIAYDSKSIYVDVNTSACGFASAPLYLTSLGGISSHYIAYGATSIYSPTSTGFRIWIYYSSGITPAQANSYQWHINWMGVPNNTNTGNTCSGRTTPGSTNWVQYDTNGIYVDVSTSACGLAAVPLYLTSLGGNSSHYVTQGATSIYSPTATGFRIYIYQGGITPTLANQWQWHINWLAITYNANVGAGVRKYYAAGSVVAMREDGLLRFLLSDHLGSTSITTDSNGSKISELRYKPWGEVRFSWGPTPTDHTYTGQYSNMDDFGLMFYGARWYDPSLGRFAQADSVIPNPWDPTSYDRYAYVRNSPVNLVDPSGHNPKCGPDGVYCDQDEWNDYDYDPVAISDSGELIIKIARELERLTGKRVTLRFVMRLIFEREFDGWGSETGDLTGIPDVFTEASGRGYWYWAQEEYGTHTGATLLNWLGGHNGVASSLYTDIFVNLPAGILGLDQIIGKTRNYTYNADVANKVIAGLLDTPDEWKMFDPNAPYSFASCTDPLEGGKCMIPNEDKRGEFWALANTPKDPQTGKYIFSTDITKVYFKNGISYIATFNQLSQYWWKP
jgi:RHS repeat-associated protein